MTAPARELATRQELRQMVQCLELYYHEQRHQKEIAKALGLSSSKVSRLLKRAFDEGLIRVELDLPQNPRLEAALLERFGLRDAVVVPVGSQHGVKEELGTVAARYFEKVAANGIAVGLSCGFTLYHTIRHLRERRFRDLILLPLSGESTLKLVDLFPNTLVGMMAAKYRPHVTAYALPLQLFGSLREIEAERRRLLKNPEIRRIYQRAQDVQIALLGIGMIGEDTPGFCSLAESYGVSVKTLRAMGVVGEINYQPFDARGQVADRKGLRGLTRRVLAVSADRLREMSLSYGKYVIAVAGGRQKLEAIRGALRGRFMNVLVTDEDTALRLVEDTKVTP
ncbi:MAG: winged helix-turn-helix transcriptional regulator [Candidatus Rokubacteria bacterium]|nr:winged helix-turn-helix transcriptional regulator [Candidatus Rokubacteria bacterium]